MTLLLSLILIATALNGGLAGGNLETSPIKLPTRQRIGNVGVSLPRNLSGRPCDAQPQTHDEEALLKPKLDRFERWQAVRATFQVLTFFILLWRVVVA